MPITDKQKATISQEAYVSAAHDMTLVMCDDAVERQVHLCSELKDQLASETARLSGLRGALAEKKAALR